MIRILALAVATSGLALAGAASAQTWGQPIYVSPYGHVVGGTPLSEVETRSYVRTGRWADGYTDQVYVYVPAPVYGGNRYGQGREDRYGYGSQRYRGYGYESYGGYGSGYGSGYRRHEPRSRAGYRDEWGYNDDRPPTARGGYRNHRHDRDCGCADVYLYDR